MLNTFDENQDDYAFNVYAKKRNIVEHSKYSISETFS